MSEFQHSSSRASCTFSMQDSRVKRGSNIGHKTQQARLPTDSGLYKSTFPSLVNCILTILECRSDHHGPCLRTSWSRQSVCSLYHPRASLGLQKFFAKYGDSINSRNVVLLVALAPCSCSLLCFAPCCHDPFIVRNASNLSTVSLVSLNLCIRLDVHDQY